MRFLLVVVLVVVAALVATSGLAQETPPAGRLAPAEIEAFVALHNRARAEVGVPPLKWSPALAARAQQWADHLAATGKFEHRPFDLENPMGENLAIASYANYQAVDGARSWYAEKEAYVPGTPIPDPSAPPVESIAAPASAPAADPATVAAPPPFRAGHYTQMVWRTTTEVGAGKAVVQIGERKGWTVIVGNYAPPGNAIGEKPY